MDQNLIKCPFQFIDDNDILFEVNKQGSNGHYRYFLLRQINGYWIQQREVKTYSLNDGPSELEVFHQKSFANVHP